MLDRIRYKGDSEIIRKKREEIARVLIEQSDCIKSEKLRKLAPDDLMILLDLYDQIFFNNWFRGEFKGKIKCSISKRMTKSAGITLCPKNRDKIKPENLVIEIRIGVDFFLHYDQVHGDKMVCGIATSNSLEALQIVFEHELCHAIEFIHFNKSSCKGNRFKTIANNVFGHTESYHKLPTYKQIAHETIGIKVGDTVTFSLSGKSLKGLVYNINKRATVMVPDTQGSFIDQKGNRYSKYYVPLNCLK